MFRQSLFVFLVAASFSVWANDDAVPGEFVVSLKRPSSLSQEVFRIRSESQGMELVSRLNSEGTQVLMRVNAPAKTARSLGLKSLSRSQILQERKALMSLIREDPEVEIVEPNYIYRKVGGSRPPTPGPNPPPGPRPQPADVLPNDPMFSQLWAMPSLFASKAWSLSKGSKDVVVAVIDTGIDYNHPDLRANIWVKPGSGGRVFGYNAIRDTLDPMDDEGHGTHVAGTIGAVGDNGIGVVGVAWNVSLMGVKFLDEKGNGSLAASIKAIDWARENGADIMNNSWGGGGRSELLQQAIERARDAGILFVAAAGNAGSDNDARPFFPAGYPVSNVISVANHMSNNQISPRSNYGVRSVHLIAPGTNIVSTMPGNKYQSLSGTSMASPQVSGAAALLKSLRPSLSSAQLKEQLLRSADKNNAQLVSKVSPQGGKLNVQNLLSGLEGRRR